MSLWDGLAVPLVFSSKCTATNSPRIAINMLLRFDVAPNSF